MVLCLVTLTDLQTCRTGLSASAELLVYVVDLLTLILMSLSSKILNHIAKLEFNV